MPPEYRPCIRTDRLRLLQPRASGVQRILGSAREFREAGLDDIGQHVVGDRMVDSERDGANGRGEAVAPVRTPAVTAGENGKFDRRSGSLSTMSLPPSRKAHTSCSLPGLASTKANTPNLSAIALSLLIAFEFAGRRLCPEPVYRQPVLSGV